MNGSNKWRAGMRARVVAVGVITMGLALYGLMGGAGRSSVVPFTGKTVSTVPTDKYSVTTTDNGGNFQAVAMGPSHSLYFYWQIASTWYGPLQVSGAGSAFSGPSMDAEDDTTGNMDLAIEGPNHTLLFFWQIGSTWYGPLQIGAPGSTWSAPTLIVDSLGHVDVSAQGPNGSLYFYWAIGGAWSGPLQLAGANTTFSAPSSDADESGSCSGGGDNCVAVATKGTANESLVYWSVNGKWTAVSTSGTNQEYSGPSAGQSGPVWVSAYVGPGNSLVEDFSYFQGGSNSYCVLSGPGTAFSPPSAVGNEQANSTTSSDSAFNYIVDGPNGSLYAFWRDFVGPNPPQTCPPFYGPLQLSGAHTAFSVPAIDTLTDTAGNQVSNALVEGPAHSLWLFWSSGGTWNGPVQVGGPGTTFDSAS